MSKVKQTRYVLAVQDLEKSVEYYSKDLGFTLLVEHPGWAFLSRDSFIVMLGECKDSISPKELGDHSYFAYIEIENADKLYKEYSSNKVLMHKELKSEPWGTKEFAIQTIDGHRIMFGEDI